MFGKKTYPDTQNAYAWCLQSARGLFPDRFLAPTQHESERIARFEAICIFAAMVAWRYEKAGDIHARDAFYQYMFADFDAALREQGVGDLKVGKEVRKLAGAFYGRAEGYKPAFDANDPDALKAAFTRNYVLAPTDDTDSIIGQILATAVRLEAQSDSQWLAQLTAA